jgi:hypothetical protein
MKADWTQKNTSKALEPANEPQPVHDTPAVRAMDGKTLEIKNTDGSSRGIFLMNVRALSPGFVTVSLVPHNLAAQLWNEVEAACEEIKKI